MKSTESRKNFISKSLLFSICLAIFICITSAVLLQNRTARIDTVTAYAEDIADNSIEIENRYATGCILETEQEKLSVPMISFEGISTLSEQVVDHTDAFPTPGDQGRQGSCTAWAVGYAAKSCLVNIGEKWGVRNHTFSPAYIFNQLNGGENAGIHIHEAMQLIIDQGVCLMSDMPYNEYDYLTQPTQSQKEKASKYRSLSKGRTKDGDINEMKAAIAVGLPVVVGVPDYPDLHNLNKSNPIYDTIEGETKTYHALCLIGYDDTKNAFKFINSWGTDSGIDGYGYIAYSLIETWRTTGWILYDAKFGQFVDSQFENTELVKYVPIVDADSEVVIAEGITKIGKEAFANQKDISTITFPKTVKQIGDNAFDGCTRLEEISSLERVTSIGTGAFANCSSLTNITIPSGVTYIGNGAFVGCSNAAIAIHASNPNYYAKDNIVYNKAQTKILFAGKIGASPEIPKSVTEVAPYAFRNNGNVEKLYIHGSPEIGAYAFADCANLEEVYCYAYTPPTLDDCAFLNDTFALYAPHSERDAYMAEFDGFVQHASFIPVTIAFVGDGEVVDTQDTYYGANITSLPTPFKTGYTFCGWFDTAACTGTEFTVGGVWDTLADMTIYAKWSPQTYCIQFSGYGCENLADKEVMYDAAIGELPTITRTGYTFYGWKNANGQLYTADTIWLETSNQMLMPDLRVNRYTVLYDGNGGTAGLTEQEAEYGSILSSLPTAYREGYIFNGWNTRADGSGEAVTAPYTVDGNVTLYARYTQKTFTATFDKQGGEGGTDGVGAAYGLPMPTGSNIVAPARIGYTFAGYFAAPNGAGTKYYDGDMHSTHDRDFDEDAVLYAHWEANTYTVTADRQGGTGGTASVTATYDANLPSGNIAPQKTGYAFGGYFSERDGKGVQYYDANMVGKTWNIAHDATIYAHWTPQSFMVVLQKEGGTGGADSVRATFDAPMPQATAPTRVGYEFRGYYTEPNGAGVQYYHSDMASANTWNIARDATLYAYWEGRTYTVTFNAQGGTGGANRVTATYQKSMPTATAPTKARYVLLGFYDRPNGNGTIYYEGPEMKSMRAYDRTENITLYAAWRGEYYTIEYRNLTFKKINANLYTYNAPHDASYYEYGVGFDLTQVRAIYSNGTTTKAQLRFLGWYTSMNFDTPVTFISASSVGTVTVYAKWRCDNSRSGRVGDCTITDKDPYSDEYDSIFVGFKLEPQRYEDLKAIGIKYMSVRFKMKLREVDDGYQEIMIYDGLSANSKLLWEVRNIEHGPGYTDRNDQWYMWTVEIDIDDLKDIDYVYIRYGAHGHKSDTWIASDLFMYVMYTSVSGDHRNSVLPFYWEEMVSDSECIPLEDVSEL